MNSKIYRIVEVGINVFHNCFRNEFFRFIIVGGLNTLFGMGIYCLMIFIGLSYALATLIAQVLGVLFNFVTTGVLVFENRNKRLIFKFIFAYLITYFINIGINKSLQVLINSNEYVSGIGATVVAALCSFVILKFFVYKRKAYEKN